MSTRLQLRCILIWTRCIALDWLTLWISAARRADDRDDIDGDFNDPDFDPDRLAVCAYWRCGELFERRTANQRYCRKACRSRQNKWQRAVERRRLKSQS